MRDRAAAPMVGRGAELEALAAAYALGQRGVPRVVVVRGDAGIGKTRLLEELRSDVAGLDNEPPAVFALGQCVEVGTIGAPFTPIRRLVRDLFHSVGRNDFLAAAGSDVVAARLGTLIPDLMPSSPSEQDPSEDAITEAIECLVENLSADRHLVLCIEDLHWADTATLGLLKTMASTLRGRHLTVLLTYRSDHFDRDHPLRPVLAELERHRAVTGLPLGPLSDPDAATLVRHLEPDITANACASIVERSQGVPFFIEELVSVPIAALPDTLRSIVLARYHRLSDPGRAVVDLLSVGGVAIEHEMLAAVQVAGGGSRGDLDRALREAVSAQVVMVFGSAYAFRHGLIREAVYADLLPGVRATHHRAYALETQARVDAGDDALAHPAAEHWLAAGDPARAFEVTVIARQHALRTLAPTTSADLGERLLDLWSGVPDAPARVGLSRRELAAQVTEQWSDIGQQERALRISEDALTAVPEQEDPLGTGLLHLARTRPLFYVGRRVEAGREAQTAVALLSGNTHPKALASVARAAATAQFRRVSSGVDMAEDDPGLAGALALAEASGDADAIATCQGLAAWVDCYRGQYEASLAAIRAVAARPGVGPVRRLSHRLAEIERLIQLGRLEEAISIGRVGMQEAIDHGRGRAHGTHMGLKMAKALFAVGRPDEALLLIRAAGQRLPSPLVAVTSGRLLGWHHAWNGDPEAAAAVRPAAPMLAAIRAEDPEERIAWAVVDTEAELIAALGTNDPEVRRAQLDRALRHAAEIASDQSRRWAGLRHGLIPAAAWALADWGLADGALAGADAGLGRTLAEGLAHALAHLADTPTSPALAALAAAEAARGAGVPDVTAWQAALAALEGCGVAIHYREYARGRLAEALLAGDRRAEAIALLDRVGAEAPAAGLAAIAAWARTLANHADDTVVPHRAPPPVEIPAASPLAALTPREREVLALVADGLTNPQIAQRLFVSPKTASGHVSSILAKLGAATRAEAAARYAAARTAGWAAAT